MLKIKYLSIGENKNEVYYLGYNLKLSPCEYRLIASIAERERISIDNLAADLGLSCDQKGNVPVHICSINRKAEIIGGRKLILCENSEYRFNEYM